jgi:hypothetical protein
MNWMVGSAYTIPARLETYDGDPIILFELNNGKSDDDAWMEQEFLRLSESELLSEPRTRIQDPYYIHPAK